MKNFDNSFLTDEIIYVAGTDEAGRGPLAGPVVAAAVLFDKNCFIEGINDSKKLSEKKREELFDRIRECALAYSVSIIDHQEIDSINILQASLKAMKTACEALRVRPSLVLVDGNKSFSSSLRNVPVVKGDSKSFAVAAASILAKVTRDRIMYELAEEYPQYNWKKNKGYPTAEHIAALRISGPCPYHRKTFLKKIIFQDGMFNEKYR